jgi:hypothetical protein
MLRLFVVGMVLLLVAEIVAGLFFLAGYFWIGGLLWGLLLAVAALLLFFLLPWIGDFALDFDSRAQELKVKLSWWGRVQMLMKETPELRVRLFGIIGYHKKTPQRKAPPPKPEPKPDLAQWAKHHVPELLRALLAALQAGQEVFSEARAIAITVNAPAETDIVDQILSGVIGKRSLGPLEVKVLPEGPRRVRLFYRISMRTLGAAGLYLLVQGRLLSLMKGMRSA